MNRVLFRLRRINLTVPHSVLNQHPTPALKESDVLQLRSCDLKEVGCPAVDLSRRIADNLSKHLLWQYNHVRR
ncbi:hypothetical protein LIA77_09987 [Sarocladium implicatum]|nr:hypothetical protein LIA77_09987 [Sarocladium implicatum]